MRKLARIAISLSSISSKSVLKARPRRQPLSRQGAARSLSSRVHGAQPPHPPRAPRDRTPGRSRAPRLARAARTASRTLPRDPPPPSASRLHKIACPRALRAPCSARPHAPTHCADRLFVPVRRRCRTSARCWRGRAAGREKSTRSSLFVFGLSCCDRVRIGGQRSARARAAQPVAVRTGHVVEAWTSAGSARWRTLQACRCEVASSPPLTPALRGPTATGGQQNFSA